MSSTVRPVVALPAIGLAAGFFSALFGVGGGVVVVPLLILVLGYQIVPVRGDPALAERGPCHAQDPAVFVGEPGRDLLGSGHALAEQRRAVAAVLAEHPGQRGLRGRAEGVAADQRQHGHPGLVGLHVGEPGR